MLFANKIDRVVDAVEASTSHIADAVQSVTPQRVAQAIHNVDPKWKRRVIGCGAIAGVTYVAPLAIPLIGALTVAQWAVRGEIVHQAQKAASGK